ncbi:uncharacterized protein [Triticum aestivum]|uniref:uncharacterized protein isoform X2 n=1 Tax=Triticum aestivum TaxID=4565 RepID=UPI001D030E00|nr:uncharacterized protein LOC123188690 isoform X2 [Triticum aestivum]
MWAGSEVGEDSSAGRQQASVLRSVASLFFSLRRGEAANDREKEQAVDECKQKGHIVLVMSGWRYCDLMSLEQSDPSKIGEPDFFCNSSTTVHEKEYVLPIGTISCGGLVLPLYFVTLWCP